MDVDERMPLLQSSQKNLGLGIAVVACAAQPFLEDAMYKIAADKDGVKVLTWAEYTSRGAYV